MTAVMWTALTGRERLPWLTSHRTPRRPRAATPEQDDRLAKKLMQPRRQRNSFWTSWWAVKDRGSAEIMFLYKFYFAYIPCNLRRPMNEWACMRKNGSGETQGWEEECNALQDLKHWLKNAVFKWNWRCNIKKADIKYCWNIAFLLAGFGTKICSHYWLQMIRVIGSHHRLLVVMDGWFRMKERFWPEKM